MTPPLRHVLEYRGGGPHDGETETIRGHLLPAEISHPSRRLPGWFHTYRLTTDRTTLAYVGVERPADAGTP